MSLVSFGKVLLFDQLGIWVALVISLSIVITVILAMLVGCLLPILAKRLGFDPAVMASPFVTTIVDAISLLVYLRIATIVLGI